MKACELSLSHKCYYVTVDSIDETEIEGIISCDGRKDKMVVCFVGDTKRYVVPRRTTNIFKLYYFSYEEAVKRQNKLRFNAFLTASVKKARAEEDYSLVMKKYQVKKD